MPQAPLMSSITTTTTTATPIKHLVVIFQENISYDHYFGTYPNATNPKENLNLTLSVIHHQLMD